MTFSLALSNTTSSSKSSCTPLDDLPDDVLCNVLLYCQFPSAVALTGTCRNLRRRVLRHPMIWSSIYYRHGFCPPEQQQLEEESSAVNDAVDYRSLCYEKRQLRSNLFRRKKKKKHGMLSPFNLPHKHFYFMPIVPTLQEDDDDDYNNNNHWDPPPIFWECDSFVLTSCSTGSELLLLDPFDSSLRVVNCLQQSVASNDDNDQAMMELALRNAAKAIHDNRHYDSSMDDQAPVAGVAIEDVITSNPHSRQEQPPKGQCLLPANNVFELDVSQYFPQMPIEQIANQEFEINHLGTDAKPIYKIVGDGIPQLQGTMVAVGRCVTSIHHEGFFECTELTTWTRSTSETKFGQARHCRLPWALNVVDLDARHQRIFCSFAEGRGPDGDARIISVYPLVEEQQSESQRLLKIPCRHAVSTFCIDATGETLLVATMRGTLELWKLKEEPYCQERWNLPNELRSSIQKELTRRTQTCDGQNLRIQNDDAVDTTQNDDDDTVTSRFSVLRRQPDLPQFHAPIQSLFVPKHLPLEHCFASLHYSREEGSSLLVWKSWQIVSLIHLRLSTRRRPRVHFDGNRIIVFGEDHIGPIILVYQVQGPEDNDDHVAIDDAGEASGGVYHLSYPPQVLFANRIRHVALGGLESMDSLHMTCNERFLIVNTRTGNLLGSSPFSEGLLVIDLHDRHYDTRFGETKSTQC